MTTDQPRYAKARLLVAEAFTRDRAADTKPDPHDLATWLLEQLQACGWRPPVDPGDTPPLRPAHATTNGPGYAAFQAERAALAARRTDRDTPVMRHA